MEHNRAVDFLMTPEGVGIPVPAGGETSVADAPPEAPATAPATAPPEATPDAAPAPPEGGFQAINDLLGTADASVEPDTRTTEEVWAAEGQDASQAAGEAADAARTEGPGEAEAPPEPAVGDLTVNERIAELEREIEGRETRERANAVQRKAEQIEQQQSAFLSQLEAEAVGDLARIEAITDPDLKAAAQQVAKDKFENKIERFKIHQEGESRSAERDAAQQRQLEDGRRLLLRQASVTHGVKERKLAQLTAGYQSGTIDSFDLSAKSWKAGWVEGQRSANLKTRTTQQVDDVPIPGGAGTGSINTLDEADAERAAGRITARQREEIYARHGRQSDLYF